jgi:phage terminase large subunit
MNVKISDKYEPLFTDLKDVDTVIITGGRYSQKSFATSLATCYRVREMQHRVLYTRYTLTSAEDSIVPEFIEKIDMLNYSDEFEVIKNRITSKKHQGKIVFRGIKTAQGNQTAKLKSLKNFSCFILDEAEEMPSYDDWKKIHDSLRATDVNNVSILLLNPTTKEHWIYEEFFESRGVPEAFNGIHGRVLYIHTTYLDVEREYIAEHIWNDYEGKRLNYEFVESIQKSERDSIDKRILKDWKYYKHSVLGGWLDRAEGVIYDDWIIGEFDYSLPSLYGLDLGARDPDALTHVAVDHNLKRIYIDELYFAPSSTENLRKALENYVGYGPLIVADAAGKRTIMDMQDYGFNMIKCKKGADSVANRIKTIQGYTLVVTPKSINLQKALNNYVWHDAKAEIPKHNWSDLCDSFGYAAMELISNTSSSIAW